MKTYKIKFLGVTLGSIGERRIFTVETQGANFYDAKLSLYNTHEHITVLKVNGKFYDYSDPTPDKDKQY
jgi:hypothetical protein